MRVENLIGITNTKLTIYGRGLITNGTLSGFLYELNAGRQNTVTLTSANLAYTSLGDNKFKLEISGFNYYNPNSYPVEILISNLIF